MKKLIIILISIFLLAITCSYADMTIQPLKIYVDEETEKNIAWANGTIVYVTNTSKTYQLQNGSFVEYYPSGKYWKDDGTLGDPSGGTADIDGGSADTDYNQVPDIDGGGA
ncbi:MAG: hypothetical protein ABSB18_06440 [Candidatus Omnitrophota bacterium]